MARRKYTGRPYIANIIFICLIIYIICFLFLFFSKKKVQIYEVAMGTTGRTLNATGLILRDETVENAPMSGNILYYQKEGQRVSVGTYVYTIDKTGRLENVILEEEKNKKDLSLDEKRQLKNMLTEYKSSYDEMGFSKAYELSRGINSITNTYVADFLSNNTKEIENLLGASSFKIEKAKVPGYIEYSMDSYVNLKEDEINKETFNKKNVKYINMLHKDNKIEEGNPAYRTVEDELWHIYIPLSNEQIKNYSLDKTDIVSILLKKINVKVTGNFEILEKSGMKIGKITLNRHILNYLSDRFLDVEIISYNDYGIKIPNTAILEKDMYVIPKEYITLGGNSNSRGFIVSVKNKETFKKVNIYAIKDGLCYVALSDLEKGSTIIKPDSNDTYIVGRIERLSGVYVVNTGYTVFKYVDILMRNEEYASIDEKNSQITLYDRILLNVSGYKEDEVIY